MFLDLLLIAVVVCFVVDISGALRNFKKPFSCSLCMTWWTGLIYLLVTGNFNLLGIAWVAFLSMMSSVITGILLWFREIVTCIIVKLTPR